MTKPQIGDIVVLSAWQDCQDAYVVLDIQGQKATIERACGKMRPGFMWPVSDLVVLF